MKRFGFRGIGTHVLSMPEPVEVQIVVDAPRVSWGDRLFLASNLNGWHPRQERAVFKRLGQTRFILLLLIPKGTILEFKITRGRWDRAEVGTGGSALPNHRYKITEPCRIDVEVADWQDRYPRLVPPHTMVGDVRSLGEFEIPLLDRKRQVFVYLPPGYEADSTRRYPVMYMYDGQNLFDASTSFSGEWQVDETCERMIRAGVLPPLIVVGIYNGEADRLHEQSPWPNPHYDVLGEGRVFAEWVATGLKGEIDQCLRTLPGPEHTGIGGSSMGGLTSLYAAFRFPEVFGRVLAMSSAFWFNKHRIYPFIRDKGKNPGQRIYLDCGHYEEHGRNRLGPLRQSREMAQLLRSLGYEDGKDLLWVEDPYGQHSEADWARRLPRALKFLWGDAPRNELRSTVPAQLPSPWNEYPGLKARP
ncbi:MAG TPA: alpha/beta hydrolase-fold protein [Stenomitos sp.]